MMLGMLFSSISMPKIRMFPHLVWPYRAYGVYATSAYNGGNGTLPSSPDNASLSWEKNYTWNVGLDAGFFDPYI